jgi:hypothetical protein
VPGNQGRLHDRASFYDGQVRIDFSPASSHSKFAVLALLSSDALGIINKDPESELPSAFSTETRFARVIASWKHEHGRVKNRLVSALGRDDWHAEIGIDQNVDGRAKQMQLRDDLVVSANKYLTVRTGGALSSPMSTSARSRSCRRPRACRPAASISFRSR